MRLEDFERESEAMSESRADRARDFLCGYRLCLDMLNLRRYERRRTPDFEELCRCEDVLSGDEAFWRMRMQEVENVISSLKNGREKLILYYHYIRGESIEHAANLLGISRRTGYRWHNRGLLVVGCILERRERDYT